MNRRSFLSRSSLLATGYMASGAFPSLYMPPAKTGVFQSVAGLYELFLTPGLNYHPFVRWWWNGNKVEGKELVRELRLLKEAGIGGVEINPVEFPSRSEGDDLGKPSLRWLSDEWIDMLKITFTEAKSLGMTCDLIVGSGWPFGSESLESDDRSQVVVIGVKKITGPVNYEISKYEIFKESDPAISSPFPGRTMKILSISMVPDPLSRSDQVIDFSNQAGQDVIKIPVPEGKHALCFLVKIEGFMQVINGVPGATGPVLNHFNAAAIKKYLLNMSDTIQKRSGPLSGNIRALFIDSMELEGANWSADMMDEFKKRRGYDLFPFLPFVLFKTGGMGNITDFKYGVELLPEFDDMIKRMRYDFEITKAEMLNERFIGTYTEWCRTLNVKSRAQAYGRGFFPLEGSFPYDIPECESWTMNWLKHKVGEEMPEEDYRRGRAYTMINKYVSSAANLKGKRIISCEEMTDTYAVFNTSLENLKIGGDQSAITGVTHSVFHGFNYSPPEAAYPGWIRYGAYYNENNNWWPYLKIYNEYKGRLSFLLQHSVMYTDIAILPPLEDMWSLIGSQMEPFPSITHVDYFTLVWEAINKNGSGCDYVTERVIRDAEIENGFMCYGPRKYHTLFLVQVESLDTSTAQKLYEFILSGGKIICIETLPGKSLGWKDHKEKDSGVATLIEKMKSFTDRFILVKKPEKNFIEWYKEIQEKYNIKPYIKIEAPDPYVMQNRYVGDDGSDILYIINSNINHSHKSKITFSHEFVNKKNGWIWDPENGKKYRIDLAKDNSFDLDMGPAESLLFVFNKEKNGPYWEPVQAGNTDEKTITNGWSAEFRHCHNNSIRTVNTDILQDLKDMPDFVNFSGTVIYRNTINIDNPEKAILNIGKVYGISELIINGKSCGIKWYGHRIWPIENHAVRGINAVEIKVVTSMGNYMKSLTGNPVAQYWTNEKNKIQPVQSMGLIGPVTIYKKNENV